MLAIGIGDALAHYPKALVEQDSHDVGGPTDDQSAFRTATETAAVSLTATGEIHGRKWRDVDGDGQWDPGEPALPDWEIYLDLNNDGRWNDTEPLRRTDAEGCYAFIDLEAGTYVVAEVLQSGWDQTYPAIGEAFAEEGRNRASISSWTLERQTATDTDEATLWLRDLVSDPVGDSTDVAETQTILWNVPRPVPHDASYGTVASVDSAAPAATHLTVNSDPEGDMPIAVVFTPDGQSVLVVNRDTDNVIVLDAASRNLIAAVPVGDYPLDVAVTPDGHYAVVPNLLSDTVSIVDLTTYTVAAHIAVTGSQLYRVAVTPDGAYAVVGVINDAINSSFSIISLSSMTEIRSFPSAPQGTYSFSANYGLPLYVFTFTEFAVSKDNTIVYPDWGSNRVFLYDADSGVELTSLNTMNRPTAVDISADGRTAVVSHYGSDAGVTKIDLATQAIAAAFPIAKVYTKAIRITPDKAYALVGTPKGVVFVDLATGAISTVYADWVEDIEISHDGSYTFVSGASASVVDIASKTVVATMNAHPCTTAAVSPVDYRAVALDNQKSENIQFYNIAGAASTVEGIVPSGQAPEADNPVTLAFAGAGPLLVVGNRISGNVSIIDVDTKTVLACVDTGMKVGGLATTPDGAYAVVANADSDTVSIVDLSTKSVVSTLQAAQGPYNLLISPDGRMAYVGTIAGVPRVHFIALAGAASFVAGSLATGNNGQMALTNDGTLLVMLNHSNPELVFVDTAGRQVVARVNLSTRRFAGRLAFSPDGSRLYVTNADEGKLFVIAVDGAASRLLTTVTGVQRAASADVDETGEFVYVGGTYGTECVAALYVIHAATNSLVQTIPLSFSEMHVEEVYLSRADSLLYVTARYDVFILGATPLFREFRQSLFRLHAAGASSSLIDATPLADDPFDLAFSEIRKTAAVALPFSDGVEIVDFRNSRTDGVHTVALGPGEVVIGRDFGNRALPGSIQGSKWHDLDGNGLWDQPEEPALEGWTIYLDSNDNGQFDEGVERSDITDAQGRYEFGGVEPGAYVVAEVPQPGWDQTFPEPATGGRHRFSLEAGKIVLEKNFGNRPLPGEIHGSVWNDLDGDGQWDQPDEPALVSWTVYLDVNLNGHFDADVEPSRITRPDGSYGFTGLPAGTYTVAQVRQAGWGQTWPDSTDSVAAAVSGVLVAAPMAVPDPMEDDAFPEMTSIPALVEYEPFSDPLVQHSVAASMMSSAQEALPSVFDL